MYRDYYSDSHLNYYVGFRTVELNQNITIVPIPKKYDTTERNVEGIVNKITISYNKEESTILTAPLENQPYIFTHIHVCTKDTPLSYEFLNAYNHSNLGYNGEIRANSYYNFKNVLNTKLDTELKVIGDNGVQIFVKHVGVSNIYIPTVRDIEIKYDKNSRNLTWNQPIENEEFEYTIYIDKIDTLKKLGYTLCSIAEVSKLGHYYQVITTDERDPRFTVPPLGKEYDDFDVVIIAEQTSKGKLTVMSPVYDSYGNSNNEDDDDDGDKKSSSNTGLLVLIVILSLVIVCGAILAFIIYRKYKSQGIVTQKNKETSMALINSTKNDKLIESQARETNQIDP